MPYNAACYTAASATAGGFDADDGDTADAGSCFGFTSPSIETGQPLATRHSPSADCMHVSVPLLYSVLRDLLGFHWRLS